MSVWLNHLKMENWFFFSWIMLILQDKIVDYLECRRKNHLNYRNKKWPNIVLFNVSDEKISFEKCLESSRWF